MKEPRKTLAAALAVLEKIDRGEAGFLSFGVTPARRAMGEVIERTDTYIKRRGAKVAAARGVQRRRIHLATMG